METTTENLIELIDKNLTIEEYTLAIYILWVESVTRTEREFQQVLSNPPVSIWFSRELSKCELEYIFLLKNYNSASIDDQNKLHASCVFKMFSIFPKHLVEAAKKRTEAPQFNIVEGYEIEFPVHCKN